MLFYFSILILFAFFSFVELFTKQKSISGYLYFFSCIFLFLLSFLRWETGTDWKNYLAYFSDIVLIKSVQEDNFELGFRVLNYIVRSFTNDYTVLLFFSGSILFLFQSIAIRKLSFTPMLSLTFFYASQLANMLFVRQWIAVSILFYSVVFIKNNKFIHFLILVLTASMIHRSAFIFILAWWIFRSKISIKLMLIYFGLSLVLSYLMEHLLNSLLGVVGNVAMQERLDRYLNESYNQQTKEEINFIFTLIKGIINRFIILLMSFYVYIKSDGDPMLKGLINMYWFGCLSFFTMMPISPALARVAYIFDFTQVILISYIFYSFKSINNRLVIFSALFIYLSMRLWQFLSGAYMDEYVPYKFIEIF